MSKEYEGQDPLAIAQQAERDLNSHSAKHGSNTADSGMPQSPSEVRVAHSTIANDSGVDAGVTDKFPGSTVQIGSAASGAGGNREIPVEEGGDLNKATGQ